MGHFGLGKTFLLEQQYPEAAAHFKTAVELNPEFKNYRMLLVSLLKANQTAAAEKELISARNHLTSEKEEKALELLFTLNPDEFIY